jgi:hypothetical protein
MAINLAINLAISPAVNLTVNRVEAMMFVASRPVD